MEHDYRTDIIKRKRDKDYWGSWDSWNILYKTLAYESTSSGDVESNKYVRPLLCKYYDDNLILYVGCDYTFDIMNGWWNCFKELFHLNSRKSDETKRFIETMKGGIVNITDKDELIKHISKTYFLEENTVEYFLDFLEVVYTIGNIAPVPKGSNKHADAWDSWEYKLNSTFLEYMCNDYATYFCFEGYSSKSFQIDNNNKEESIRNYMAKRKQLIKSRGQKLKEKEI